jgi:hypothetical protein
MGRTILEMEGKEHQRHRKIVTPAFSPRALRNGIETTLDEIVHAHIDGTSHSRWYGRLRSTFSGLPMGSPARSTVQTSCPAAKTRPGSSVSG